MALDIREKFNHPLTAALVEKYGEKYFLLAENVNAIVAAINAIDDREKPEDGTKWFSDAGQPADYLGEQGDFYLDELAGDYYEKTGAEEWTKKGSLKGTMGAIPDHEWDGTNLRLQRPDGSWGNYVNLKFDAEYKEQEFSISKSNINSNNVVLNLAKEIDQNQRFDVFVNGVLVPNSLVSINAAAIIIHYDNLDFDAQPEDYIIVKYYY